MGSVDYAPTTHPLTISYRLAHIPRTAAIAIADLTGPGPARYATADGSRPGIAGGTTFDIYTPWDITVVKQLAGSQPTRIFADGGVIGCDRLSGAPTWSLAAGTRAVVVTLPTADRPTPAGWQAIMWTWQVVGDRVLLPQPAETVGTGFDAISVNGVNYNGQTVPGSSISLAALESYVAKNF